MLSFLVSLLAQPTSTELRGAVITCLLDNRIELESFVGGGKLDQICTDFEVKHRKSAQMVGIAHS
jgi:hypothetical protein